MLSPRRHRSPQALSSAGSVTPTSHRLSRSTIRWSAPRAVSTRSRALISFRASRWASGRSRGNRPPPHPHPGGGCQTAGGSGETPGTGPTRTCTLQALIADTYACGALAAGMPYAPDIPCATTSATTTRHWKLSVSAGIYECVYCGQAAPDPSAAHGVGGGTPGSTPTGSGPAPNHP